MINTSNMRSACSLLFKSNFKHIFQAFSSRPQFFPVVRVVSSQEDNTLRLSFKINNSPNLSVKVDQDESVSSVLARIKLMAALQRKREEIRRDIKRKYSNSGHVEEEIEEVIDVCLVGNNEVIKDSTKNIHGWSQAKILKVGDTEYEVHFNVPIVTSMSLPDYIVPGCFLRPHILTECASFEDSLFVWYRSTSNCETDSQWIRVGEGFHYLTTSADSNCYLKVICSPKRGKLCGPDFMSISKNVVEPGPINFLFDERQKWTEPVLENDKFRCISYNTLANMYVERKKFPYASNKARDVYYRKQLLIREILGYNSDIMCLQEIQGRVYDLDLFPILKKEGFDGIYTRKGGRRHEGLATFFRTSKFRVIFNQGILLNEIIKDRTIFVDLLAKVGGNFKDLSKLLAQDTAFQVLLLEAKENFRILIANTHLYSNKDNPEVRLLQAAMCLYYLEHLIKTNKWNSLGVLFCGDFNSLPDSEAYKFITFGKFQCCSSWKNNNIDLKQNEDSTLQHSLSLESACGTPEYTNYTEEFQGCLDYIFYSKDYFEVTQVVPFPSHESVTAQIGLPNEFYPSDHIALVCTFKQKSN